MADGEEYAIVFAGSAAVEKALSILGEKREELEKRYPLHYLKDAENRLLKEKNSLSGFCEIMKQTGISYISDIQDVTKIALPCNEDGVFAALWRLGEALDFGLKVKQDDIPIDQAVVELCDYLDISPYETDSTGVYVLALKKPGEIIAKLKEKNIPAKLIGYTTKDRSRIIIGATERYLMRCT